MNIPKRPLRVPPQLSAAALLLLVGWIGWSLKHPPAGTAVSSARLALYVLPAVVFMAGHQLAGWRPRHPALHHAHVPWALTIAPSGVATATLFAATQLPRAGVVLYDKDGTWLLVFCSWLALWAGMLAQQLRRDFAAGIRGRWGDRPLQARRLTAALASAAGFLGTTGMWIGFVSGSETLVRHGWMCLAATVARILALRGSEARQKLVALGLCGVCALALLGTPVDPGVSRPAAFAVALVLAGIAPPRHALRCARWSVVVAAAVTAMYAVTAPAPWPMLDAHVALATVSGTLVAATGTTRVALRTPRLQPAERERLHQRALFLALGSVITATPWMTGLDWPWLLPGAGVLLVAGLLTTQP